MHSISITMQKDLIKKLPKISADNEAQLSRTRKSPG